MARKHNLIGKRFHNLVVVGEAEPCIFPSGQKHNRWLCRCDCGNLTVTTTGYLNSGHTKSCGCLSLRHMRQMGLSNKIHGGCVNGRAERLYKVWSDMKERCYNCNSLRYKDWGGRGIVICDEWKNSYSAFKKWALENGYDENAKRGVCTIDRIDNDGNYCPENCRWVDMKEQVKTRRKGVYI